VMDGWMLVGHEERRAGKVHSSHSVGVVSSVVVLGGVVLRFTTKQSAGLMS
jgi:hypothetical protein